MLLALCPPLQSGVGEVADLLAVEHRPFFPMEKIVEILNKSKLLEVNKSIANVALKLQIDRQIEEIELPLELSVDQLQHQLLIVLIGYVLDHHSGLSNLPNLVPVDLEGLLVLHRQSLPGRFLLLRLPGHSQETVLLGAPQLQDLLLDPPLEAFSPDVRFLLFRSEFLWRVFRPELE